MAVTAGTVSAIGICEVLTGAGFATLLFDLLTRKENTFAPTSSTLRLLASRLIDVTGWLATQPDRMLRSATRRQHEAGAALVAAADPRERAGGVQRPARSRG